MMLLHVQEQQQVLCAALMEGRGKSIRSLLPDNAELLSVEAHS